MLQDLSLQDKRIKVINQVNSGVSQARNNGLKNSSGKYIGTDADEGRNIQYIIFKKSRRKTAGSYTKTYKEIKKIGKLFMKKFSKKKLLKKCKN